MKGYDRKLFTGIVFILLLFLPVLGSAIYSLNKVISAQNRISKYADQLLVAGDLRRLKTQQLSLMPIYVLRGDEAVLGEMNKTTTTFIETAKKLTTMTDDEEKRKLLAEIEKDQLSLQSLAQPGIEMRQRGASTSEVTKYFGRVSGPVTMAIMNKLDQLVQKITDNYEIEKADNDKMSRTIINSLLFASALSVLLSLLVGSLLVKLIRQKEAFDKNNEVLTQKERALSNARKETVEVVAHDLKNPLASILMSTQMTLKREKNNPDQHLDSISNLERTMRSAQSMKRLIDDLLDHAKIESGSFTLDKKECDVEMLVKTLASRFEPIAQSKNMVLRFETPLHLPKVHMDEGRIEQVITNFIGNAMKFTQAGGSIRISADIQDKNLIISVSDNGPGMNQDQMDHVFERYWQVRETAKKGTGLGLAISKAIILAHNGKIKVKSEIGKGSTFYFSIPVSDDFKHKMTNKDYSEQYLHS